MLERNGDEGMSWDRIEGQWKQRRGKAMHQSSSRRVQTDGGPSEALQRQADRRTECAEQKEEGWQETGEVKNAAQENSGIQQFVVEVFPVEGSSS
jgi:hypothetical protein